VASTRTTSTYGILSTHKKRERARDSLRRWIRTQDIWDDAFERVVGERPYPPPEQVYRIVTVRRRNHPIKYHVVWADPTV
jgi:hypothetical protein